VYKEREYKRQKVERLNTIMVVCANCGAMYEEEPMGVNVDYSSISLCPECNAYNSI